MRYCKIPFLIVILSICQSCFPETTTGSIGIYNGSGEVLFVESNLQGANDGALVAFRLEDGFSRLLCSSDKSPGTKSEYSMDEICSNLERGQVSLYRYSESGERVLVKQWRFADQHKKGRHFFNFALFDKETIVMPNGNTDIEYIFTVTPDDLLE